jgi:predicted transcriptional regulator
MLDQERPELTLAIIEDLKRKGFTQSEIARMFGVTRQAVSWHKKTYGGALNPREIVNLNFPWKVSAELAQASVCRQIRDHGEYMATGGKGMSQAKLDRVRTLYRKLRRDNVVVEYDPAIPPQPGVCVTGGFAFRPRLDTDGDLLIRVNQHTNMTEEGRMIWRFPPTDP